MAIGDLVLENKKLGVALAEKLCEIAEVMNDPRHSQALHPRDFAVYGQLEGRQFSKIRSYAHVPELQRLIDEYKPLAVEYDKRQIEIEKQFKHLLSQP